MSLTAFNRYRRLEAMKPENLKAKTEEAKLKAKEEVKEELPKEEVKTIVRRKKK